MGGFLGIGHTSAKTDRATQLAAQQGQWNVFNQNMSAGTSAVGGAQQYFRGLMAPGRTQATQNAAPAIQAGVDQATANRTAGAAGGTGRSGGTAAVNANAGEATAKESADIVNQNLVQGRQAGAQGLMSSGLQQLGLSEDAINSIMGNATESRKTSLAANSAGQNQWLSVISSLLGG